MIQSIRVWLYHALLEQKATEKLINPFLIFILCGSVIFGIINGLLGGYYDNFRNGWTAVFGLMGVIEYYIWSGKLKVGKLTYTYRAMAFVLFPLYEILKLRYDMVQTYCGFVKFFQYCDFITFILMPTLEILLNSLEQYHKNENQ